MGREREFTERVNFDLTGELAEWMHDMKERGLFASNPEIIRLAITVLRHHYSQTAVPVDQKKN